MGKEVRKKKMNYENDGMQNKHIAEHEHGRLLASMESTCSRQAIERFREEPYQLKYMRAMEKRHDKKNL